MRFHEKYGFKVMSIFENVVYKHNKWINVVWMRKALKEFKDNVKNPIAIGDLDDKLICNIFNKNIDKIKG